jgi:putative SOS response-associated peptidase YedK
MPVILPPAAWDLWLDAAAQPRELRGLLTPYPASLMDAYPVGTAVGNIRNDGPELIRPLAPNGLDLG